jgi:intracellular septation protein
MKQILDFLPILISFGAYKAYGMYVATAVMMVCTVIQMAILYFIDGKLQAMHKVTLVLILVFGAMTLGFHDERFIKIKPTVLYTFMAAALGIGYWGFKRNFLQTMFGEFVNLPKHIWRNLTVAWVIYAISMASLNAFIVYFYTTDQWWSFKIWGFIIPIVFLIGQGFYIAKYLQPKDGEAS